MNKTLKIRLYVILGGVLLLLRVLNKYGKQYYRRKISTSKVIFFIFPRIFSYQYAVLLFSKL